MSSAYANIFMNMPLTLQAILEEMTPANN